MSHRLRYLVHAYAWTSSWSNDDLDLIDHSVELGLDGIEIPLMEIEKIDAEAIGDRAEATGAELVTSVAMDAERDPSSESPEVRARAAEFLRQCVDAAAAMGSPMVTGVTYSAMGGRLDHLPGDPELDRAAEVLGEAARYAASHDVTIGIEPVNRYESYLVNTGETAGRLMRMIGEPNVGVHLDAYHMNIEETGFYDPVRAAVPDLIHFHLSESHRGVPGTGTVDWRSVMRALVDGGYRGYVGLESFAEVADAMRGATCVWRDMGHTSDELVREGLAFLRGVENELAAA